MAYEHIDTEIADGVAVITMNRGDAMNTLSRAMSGELARALAAFDADDAVGCIVLTGGVKAFSKGVDFAEMIGGAATENADLGAAPHDWEIAGRLRTPIVAAVAGYAMGAGCELALMCDIIVASKTAKFAQPEITYGATPAAGGTQRLPRAVGKSKAMEMCLTGRTMGAEEAERAGLVSAVVEADDLISEAMRIAKKVASMSRPIAMATKEAVNAAFEASLEQGSRFERRVFQALATTADRSEGIAAKLENREPHFKHR